LGWSTFRQERGESVNAARQGKTYACQFPINRSFGHNPDVGRNGPLLSNGDFLLITLGLIESAASSSGSHTRIRVGGTSDKS
jgi:hypothetical protein